MSSPPPSTEKKKEPWANRVVQSEIEYTEDYMSFMRQLQEYHERRGTTLTPEPELGKKKLCLRKLYQSVTSLGGYDELTKQKGFWRNLAQTYKLAANNTNSGYLLKTIYYKNLAAFEISNFFGKEPPPKEELEFRSAKGGAIMTRSAEEEPLATSPKRETNGEPSASPPPVTMERRSLRQAPTPRTFYSPDTTPQRQSTSRAVSATSHQTQPSHTTNGVNGTASYPTFQQNSVTAPVGRPVPTPMNAPDLFNVRKRPIATTNAHQPQYQKFGAGKRGANEMQRIVMGLRSGLDTEEEYSLDRLIIYSFERGDELYVSQFPPLADLLFERIESVGKLVEEFKVDDQKDSVDNAHFVKRLNKITQAALIVRNLSINHHNAKLFAEQRYTKDILVQILNLPTHPNFSELKNYALDMIELMASSFPFFKPDPLFDALAIGLNSDDRGVLLGSMKSLSRFVMGRDEFNRLGEISESVVFRITSLLMLEDEDLASACLDFLYQYTANDENVEKLLQPPQGVELTRHLIRLLLFQGLTGEQIVYLRTVKKPPPTPRDIPPLPQDIINDLLGYPEPERAAKWMRCCFEEDTEAEITQIALWQAYQQRFNEFVNTHHLPLLPAAEFIKNVSVAFNNASAMVIPTSTGQKFIIKGIRARETPMSVKGVIYISCKWFTRFNDSTSKCKEQCATPQDLWSHILKDHLPPPESAADQQPLTCNWDGCTRFPADGEPSRLNVVRHVRTHMPDPIPKILLPEDPEFPNEPDSRVIIRRCETGVDERGEAAGIPLTAVLVLRNICRRGALSWELINQNAEGLYEVMAENRPLAGYVSDVLLEAARFDPKRPPAVGV